MSEMHTDTKIAQMVRSTLHAATQPDNRRLAELMPPIPSRQRSRWTLSLTWQRQLATACVGLLLILGGLGLSHFDRQSGVGPAPTLLAITATYTTEPTNTAVRTATTIAPTATAVAADPATAPQPALYAPSPPPTPVAHMVRASN